MAETKKSFKGGYKFRKVQGAPQNTAVEEVQFPDKISIPLRQGGFDLLKPCVQEGDTVDAGQIVAQDDENYSNPLLATISGTVESIVVLRRRPITIIITGNGSKEHRRGEDVPEGWESAAPDAIGSALYRAGVTALGEAGIPTRHRSAPVEPAAAKCIVVGAVDADPVGLPSGAVIGDGKNFITGLSILRRALSDVPVHVAVDVKNSELQDILETAARDQDWLKVHPVVKKYPADAPVVLAQTITGARVAPGKRAVEAGVVVITPQTAIHAYEAIVEGKPLIEKLIALGGTGFKAPGLAKVRIGSPYAALANGRIATGVEPRLVANGILGGTMIADQTEGIERNVTHVTALVENRKREMFSFMRPGLKRDSYTNSFLSALAPGGTIQVDTNYHGEHRPCIACSYCDEVCPRDLLPHLLNKYVEHDMQEDALEVNILACIDCGLCSYVCPSKIPLMQNIIAGKNYIVKKGWHEESA